METAASFEMLVNNYQTTRCHSLEYRRSTIFQEVDNHQQVYLKMEAAAPLKTMVTLYHTARRHNPETDHNMIIRKGANYKPSYMVST
jgi:hypothetical protein